MALSPDGGRSQRAELGYVHARHPHGSDTGVALQCHDLTRSRPADREALADTFDSRDDFPQAWPLCPQRSDKRAAGSVRQCPVVHEV